MKRWFEDILDTFTTIIAWISGIFIVLGMVIGGIFLVISAFLISKIGLILAIVVSIGIAYWLWGG